MFEIIVGLALIPLALYGLVLLLSVLFAARSIVIPIIKAAATGIIILISLIIARDSDKIMQPIIFFVDLIIISLIWVKADQPAMSNESITNKHSER